MSRNREGAVDNSEQLRIAARSVANVRLLHEVSCGVSGCLAPARQFRVPPSQPYAVVPVCSKHKIHWAEVA